MTSEDSLGFSDWSLGQVVAAVGHDTSYDVASLDSDSSNSRQVLEALTFAAEPIVAEVAFLVAGAMCHGPEGMPQEWRAAFADMAMRGLVLAALRDDQIEACEGDQLRRRSEGLDRVGFLFSITCTAQGAITDVVLMCNNQAIQEAKPNKSTVKFDWVDANPPDASHLWYYVRVHRDDRQMAWLSPIWFLRSASR